MEKLLHYIWRHKMFPLGELRTIQGEIVEVIDSGIPNQNDGPDFFNAKIKINGLLWVGNVEIHTLASDWIRHHHDTDAHYNNVILHVVEDADVEIQTLGKKVIPTLQLKVPSNVEANYKALLAADVFPPCYAIVEHIPTITLHGWMDYLRIERLERKTQQFKERLAHSCGDWEDATFVTLARNFGFGLNGDAFEVWANHIPLNAVNKHRDDLFQVEAIFFGQAGLLNENHNDPYYLRLQKEYAFLAHKFSLVPMDASYWRFMRTRPQNFPHVRIAQLAAIYNQKQGLLSLMAEAKNLSDIAKIFHVHASEYWNTHYNFGCLSINRTKVISSNAVQLLTINTIVTTLYAYGTAMGKEELCERAGNLLEMIKPENNYIIRIWHQVGLQAQHAGDSQALIQLKKEYCDSKKCLYCRIGYEYLKRKTQP